MDVIAAYQDVGSYRGAAAICGTTHKTVRRIIEAQQSAASGTPPAPREVRPRNCDAVADLVAERVKKSCGRISAKRLLPVARAAGYGGSARNFRRLVARVKSQWRAGQARQGGRRPAVWSPGETLVIDWGEEKVDGRKVQVFCAVLAWSRFRFVRFATDQQQATTLGLLAACFDALGGVPKVVLADRAACLKGGVVANVVVPAPDYVRFAAHYRFRPDFCNAADPQSKGIVENLVGYAKDDLLLPLTMDLDAEETPADGGVWLTRWNTRAQAWCAEVNAAEHSEICAVGDQRLVTERELLTPLPSLRLQVGPKPISRRVDKLSCIRFGSARYSVPNALIGSTVTVLIDEQHRRLQVIGAVTGEIRAEHRLVPPGATSIVDDHYGRPRPDRPVRRARPVTPAERDFLALGPVAEAFLTGAAAAGVTKLPGEIDQILQLQAAHGSGPLLAALERAVAFGRWRAGDVRSILATGGHAPHPTPPGQALVMTLPTVPTRPLDAYRLDSSGGEAS